MLADTYVWSDAEDPDLYGEWDFEVRVFHFVHLSEPYSQQTRDLKPISLVVSIPHLILRMGIFIVFSSDTVH